MKTFILAALLLSTSAFADQAAYVKLGDIKGETEAAEVVEGDLLNAATESREAIEGDLLNTTRVIDNEEQAAEEVKDAAAIDKPGGGSTGQTRRRGDVIMEDVSVEEKRSEKANTKAQDYNSSRSNRRGARDAASGLPTGKRQHRKLDEDSDNDGVPTTEVCNDKDTDRDGRGDTDGK